jgi:hypothetical protein
MRRLVPWLVFLATLLLVLFLHRCSRKQASFPEPPRVLAPVPGPGSRDTVAPAPPETATTSPPAREGFRRRPDLVKGPDTLGVPVTKIPPSEPDTLPYVYADPWGGRHFDSATVILRCLEHCAILYSVADSADLREYDAPLVLRRNATLWFTGLSRKGRRSPLVRLEYVIEKNPETCPALSMPVSVDGRAVCVDAYEWPNRENALPRAMVSRDQAEDSCRSAGKRLCSLEEWRAACRGPRDSRYPYGEDYDERYCPAQQSEPSRSGRFPACRSYDGLYDLTGNLWEWTSTANPDHPDFYFVAGGGWDAAEKATCGFAKYSFYPQNRYPAVGFRCCAGSR